MDLGLHGTLTDSNSTLDPEVVSVAKRLTPNQAKEFGKAWDLFQTRATPFKTDTYDVLTRGYTSPVVTLGTIGSGTDWNSTSDTTALPITSGTISRLTVGDALLVEDEIVVVKSVDRSGNTIDVYERGTGDTAGAAHTGTLTALIIDNVHLEGTVDAEAMAEQTDKLTGYMKIILESVDLSKEDSDQARKTGTTAETLKGEAMARVMRDLARGAIYGVARANTASIPGMARGVLSHLRDVSGSIKTALSGAWTEDALQDILDDVRVQGGTINGILMSVAKKRISNGFTGADTITVDRADGTGGHVLKGYESDGFGFIPFIVDIDWPNSAVAVVNSNDMWKGWKENDQLRFVPETNVSSREKKETLQGKASHYMEGVGQTHGLVTDIT